MNERTLLLEEAEDDIRKGTAIVKVGLVMGKSDDGCEVLWAEYNQPKAEIALFKKLLHLEDLTSSELNQIRPYHFKDVYIRNETEETLKNVEVLELATTAWLPLTLNTAWEEDVEALMNSCNELDKLADEANFSLVRPHWTQVEADKALQEAVDDWARQQTRFMTYWKDKSPFDKDEIFQLLINENLIRHPDTIRH